VYIGGIFTGLIGGAAAPDEEFLPVPLTIAIMINGRAKGIIINRAIIIYIFNISIILSLA
jgi:hypothetical protein